VNLANVRLFLDTNQWTYLLGGHGLSYEELGPHRERLADLVGHGELTVVASVPVLEELLPIYGGNPELYSQVAALIFETVGPHWLRPLNEFHIAEAHMGGLLRGRGPYLSPGMCEKVRAFALLGADLEWVTAENARQADAFKAEQEALRAEVLERFRADDELDNSMHAVMTRWWEEVDRAEWVAGVMQGGVERGLLLPDLAANPSIDSAPTAWHFMSFKLARMKLNLGDNRRISKSDASDAQHYASAVYADVLVTDDSAFLETAGLLDDCPFRLESFADLVERLA
jgi:hypothetical protein